MANGIPLGEFTQYAQSIWLPATAGLSEAARKLSEIHVNEALTSAQKEAKKYEVVADHLVREFKRIQEYAQNSAIKALNAADPRRAQAWERYADVYSRLASERLDAANYEATKAYVARTAGQAEASIRALGGGLARGLNKFATAAQLADSIVSGDPDAFLKTMSGLLGGALMFGLAVLLLPEAFLATIGGAIVLGIFAGFGTFVGEELAHELVPHAVRELTGALFEWAQHAIFRRDPLTLDLDGDGLETVGSGQSNILFDHDGDGILTGTGWVLGDDGFLVFDRNGNGAIDSGLELFGDSTPLASGGRARDGFEALAQEDTNHDGIVSAADARWDDLRVWRDANQDGVSQADELLALGSLGIASLRVAPTEHSRQLPNGNQIADLGTYTRSDGSSGTLGEVGQLADVNLAEDTFHREFTDSIPLAEGVTDPPNMQASGKVRDLWEAASLSASLKDTLTVYSQAGSREAQLELLDTLVLEWADTAGLPDVYARAAALTGENQYGANPHGYVIRWAAFGDAGGAPHQIGTWTDGSPVYDSEYAGLIQHWEQGLKVLEAFNGRPYFVFPGEPGVGAAQGLWVSPQRPSADGTYPGPGILWLTFQPGHLQLLEQSYAALRESVYDGLILQTRLKPFLDAIGLTVDDAGARLDFAGLTPLLDERIAADAPQTLSDLAEFNRYAKDLLTGTDYPGDAILEHNLRTLALTPELAAAYDAIGIRIENVTTFTNDGTNAPDVLVGSEAANLLYGHDGDDALFGGAGIDQLAGGSGDDRLYGGVGDDGTAPGYSNDNNGGGLYGGAGDDLLDGGAGNDYLQGDTGNDVYLFGRGDGRDIIQNFDGWNGTPQAVADAETDALQFKAGIAPGDITARRQGQNLVLTLASGESVRVNAYFAGDTTANSTSLDEIRFADGTVWTRADVRALVLAGSDAGETITGFADTGDTIDGAGGNDLISGLGADDVLRGGAGIDVILGGAGADRIFGGDGDDGTAPGYSNDNNGGGLYGGDGDDVIDGGAGVDYMQGDRGNDTYVFGRGYGQDIIQNFDGWNGTSQAEADLYHDVLSFDAGVLASDVVARRVGDNLLLSIAGTDDTIRVNSYFQGNTTENATSIDEIRFADGTAWTREDVRRGVLVATDLGDTIIGFDGIGDEIDGGAGNDAISGRGADDHLLGGDGDDRVEGDAGADLLEGGAGIDLIVGGAGADRIFGGDGDDGTAPGYSNDNNGGGLYGGDGDDVIDGGAGVDYMQGDRGNDTYVFGRGYGQDIIQNFDGWNGTSQAEADLYHDVLSFDAGVLASDVVARRVGDNLLLSIAGTDDTIRVNAYFSGNTTLNPASIAEVRFADGTAWSRADVRALVLAGTDAGELLVGFVNVDNTIDGAGGNDRIEGQAGDDVLRGGAGVDVILGGAGADRIVGGDGDDGTAPGYSNDNNGGGLYGGDGDDVIDGGAGVDYMEGNRGNDTYVFGRGYGQDIIQNYDGWNGASQADADRDLDVLVFNPDVLPGEVIARRVNDNLVLSIAGTTDAIRINAYFAGNTTDNATSIDEIRFADGTVWGRAEARREILKGTDAGETIVGFDTLGDEIDGRGGPDRIYGGSGDDVLLGGDGNDSLQGEAGADVLRGQAGDDELHGQAGDDVLDGGAGNDWMRGLTGSDVYRFGRGYGRDTIENYDRYNGPPEADAATAVDAIEFAADVAPGDVLVRRGGGASIVLSIIGTADALTVGEAFSGNRPVDDRNVDEVRFADGTVWDRATLARLALAGTDGAETLTGFVVNDTIRAGAGDDRIYGDAGADLLEGETGDDQLSGDAGDDVLDGGAGNDSLHGGLGSDTFVFGFGYGQDTVTTHDTWNGIPHADAAIATDEVLFTAAVQPGDVRARRASGDLLLTLPTTGDSLRVYGFFGGDKTSPNLHLDRVRFADGTIWSVADLRSKVLAGTAASETLTGFADSADVIDGLDGGDTLEGRAGDDTLQGGDGHDRLYGDDGHDLLVGGAGDDQLSGGAGDDVLDGGAGADSLSAHTGSDTYVFGRGYGQDSITNYDSWNGVPYADAATAIDRVVFRADVAPGDVVASRNNSDLVLAIAGTADRITISAYFWNGQMINNFGVDEIRFADGTVWDAAAVRAKTSVGTPGRDSLIGFSDADILAGLGDTDYLYGGGGDDFLLGGESGDVLYGEAGNDVSQGGAGDDSISDGAGANLLDGGAGRDSLTGGDAADLLIGGAGNDEISPGAGSNLIAFNRGDGQDRLWATAGAHDRLSLGGGIAYEDVKLEKYGGDLVIHLGNGERLNLGNWYGSAVFQTVEQVQFIAAAMAGYDPAGADVLRDQQVEGFDFKALVAGFDAARAQATVTQWAVMDALLAAHLAGSDTEALGGDLAYRYGTSGSLAQVGLSAAQAILADPGFGASPQALKGSEALGADPVKLAG